MYTIILYQQNVTYIHTHTTYDNTLEIIARLMFALSEIILYSRKWVILSNELKFSKNCKLTEGTESKQTETIN